MAMNIIFEVILVSLLTAPALSQVIRPCEFSDFSCIGNELQRMSRCSTEVFGPEDIDIQYNVVYDTPTFNTTFVDYVRETRNLMNCSVSEFFINENSNTIVFAMDCPDIVVMAERRLYQHYPASEDAYYTFNVTTTYGPIRFTTNLKEINDYSFCNSRTKAVAYLSEVPTLDIKAFDEASARFRDEDRNGILSNLKVYAAEELVNIATSYVNSYVSAVICDYQCLLE